MQDIIDLLRRCLLMMKTWIIMVALLFVAITLASAAPRDGLMLYFTFDDGTADLSGNGHDGNLLGAAEIDNNVVKNGNGALRIGGGSDAMEVETFTELEEYTNHSLLFWINFTAPATGGWDQIIAKPAPGGDRSPGLWVTPEGLSIHWRYNPGNIGPWGITKSGNQNADFFDENVWFHVAGACDVENSNITAYVNGEEVAVETIPGAIDQGPYNFYIGNSPAYAGVAAKFVIDDVAFYNRILDEDEIISIMNGALNPVEPGDKVASTWAGIKVK
jgi:hypothetical protein